MTDSSALEIETTRLSETSALHHVMSQKIEIFFLMLLELWKMFNALFHKFQIFL
jgi:hypothetical protein